MPLVGLSIMVDVFHDAPTVDHCVWFRGHQFSFLEEEILVFHKLQTINHIVIILLHWLTTMDLAVPFLKSTSNSFVYVMKFLFHQINNKQSIHSNVLHEHTSE